MKKIISAFILFANLLVFQFSYAQTNAYHISEQEIHEGYISKKIWLKGYAVPKVSISAIGYTTNVPLPNGVQASDPTKLTVAIGMERKRPFAVIHIPAYTAGTSAGTANRVSEFVLSIEEQPESRNSNSAAKTTDVANSVLAQGTWYKIGITKTGFYKLDYNFISAMGVNPANVNPANIRIVGNGGHMLSEDNAVTRPSDLIENAILVNSGGSTFGTGDNVIFYGVGPQEWDKDSVNQRFYHQNNFYTDTAYYFISFDQGAGLRISQQGAMAAGNVNVTDFNYYDAHELDLVSPAGVGKYWYGEEFAQQLSNATQTFSFDMGVTVPSVYCKVYFAGTCDASGSNFTASVNGTNLGPASPLGVTPASSEYVMALNLIAGTVTCNAQQINVGVTYNAADASGLGYLYYIELNARRGLTMTGDQLNFRDWQSVGAGNIANYQLQGANGSTTVWDVTNPQVPQIMNGVLTGSNYTFTQDASMLHEFAAMNSSNLYAPKYIAKVANQNLHSTGPVDLIIVTYPDFEQQAKQLADYHRNHDNMRVVVATTDEVYNEFSSGAQDVSAIRDFARMFYKRAGTDSTKMPSYLLLFGSASYDYKNRLAANDNFVPVYESWQSLDNISGFSTDDFFGFLDDNENINNTSMPNALDIGIGRLPARSQDDATALVNKIISYTNPATLGPWRLATLFVAEANDGAGQHLDNADTMAYAVDATANYLYNEDKAYIDATVTVSTPAGARCPNINAAIDNDVYKGVFLLNYNGHGNTQVWAIERVLTEDDYNSWNNTNALPFMVTATCDFGQFDHPQFVSAAEQMVLRVGGGVICALTTTAAVYADFNVFVNQQYLQSQFARNANHKWNSFGDAVRISKNITYVFCTNADELANFRKFVLLGDPALTPDFPQYNIVLDSVNDGTTLQRSDTVKALGAYEMYGSVHDNNGNILTDFNGLLSVSFFDKPTIVTTISGTNEKFKLQNNIIYKGRVSVTNGIFKFTFIAPKDINYYYGTGKVSTYAENGITDAAGADTSITVGGLSDHPVLSSAPPIVKAYIGDSLFLNGGITGANTSLFVSLFDSTGINVSGTNVGHDLTAVLDGNVEVPYILNDYYETAPNTYQYGSVSFPINGLADGAHTITVKAWDVNDNVGEGSVNFIVVDGQVMDIQNLMNYPNPFSSSTNFVFEHNHPDEQLDVKINIYNTSGGLVKRIQQSFTPTGSRSNEISWDGTDDNGARLPSGVYVYRLNISTDKGFQSSAYQKLVIVR